MIFILPGPSSRFYFQARSATKIVSQVHAVAYSHESRTVSGKQNDLFEKVKTDANTHVKFIANGRKSIYVTSTNSQVSRFVEAQYPLALYRPHAVLRELFSRSARRSVRMTPIIAHDDVLHTSQRLKDADPLYSLRG